MSGGTRAPRVGALEVAGAGRAPTPEELALLPTCGELPVRLAGVSWPDRSPVVVTVRALTFAERAACNREAAEQAKRGPLTEDEAWALAVVRRGLVRPALTDAQIAVLSNLNARIIDDLADTITRLGQLDPRDITAALEALAGVETPPAPPAGGAAAGGAPDAEHGGDAGAPVRAPRGRRGGRAA